MKKRVTPLHCFVIVLAAVIGCAVTALSACTLEISTSSGHEGGDYTIQYRDYNLHYDVHSDRTMDVTEEITVEFIGRDCTGLIIDIPVNGGEQVRNVTVHEITSAGRDISVDHRVMIEDNDFISVDIGDTTPKRGDTRTYVLSYTYCMTKAQEGQKFLEINVVSPTYNFEMSGVDVEINLPEDCLRAEYYLGRGGSKNSVTLEGGKNIVLNDLSFEKYEGLTVNMEFESGALHEFFDFSPYFCAIAAAILLVVIILVKLLFFNKNPISPVVHYEAPDGMNPLIMGKLIDNKVNSEDVTALIFYWADKGYVKINLDNKYDSVIIKIRDLPATGDGYEQVVFAGLFRTGDSVKTSDLRYSFYTTFERAAGMVNEKAKGLYMSSSIGISVIFALLAGLITGLAPFILGLMQVSPTLTYFYGFIALIPALVLYGFGETVAYNRLKNKGKKNILLFCALGLAIALGTGLFTLIIPSSIMPLVPKILTCALAFVDVTASVLVISRTHDYTEKLNDIVGFRDFISSVEKDKLEELLESDPQYYYHVLPYAQVLNVSDKWEEKFASLTVEPPQWAVCSAMETLINFRIVNSLIRNSTESISSGMIARPSSSGSSGGHGGFGGGFGGGHVGGGHGGSSARGR